MHFDPKWNWSEGEGKVLDHLTSISATLERFERWIVANTNRTGESQMTVNLLCACRGYLELMTSNLNNHISVLALAARSIYELRLRLEHLYLSRENVDDWQFETISDFIELCDARLKLPESPEDASLRDKVRLARLEYVDILSRYGRKKERAIQAVEVAGSVGLKIEHEVFFKFMSKLVHPSGYLVNKPERAGSFENQFLMIWYAQLSARHILERVKSKFSMPLELPEPKVAFGRGA